VKLATKLSLSAVAVFSIAIIGGGYSLIELNYSNEARRISSIVDQAVQKISSGTDTLSSALVVANETDLPLTFAFVDMDKQITTIVESSVRLVEAPRQSVLQKAVEKAIVIDGVIEYQLRAIDMGGGEFLLVATSTEAARHARDNNLLALALASVLAIALSGAAITILIRRDLKSVIQTIAATADQERETRQSMQTFMGDASHELRTPLTVIKGYAELLSQSGAKTSADQRKRAYGRIVEQVNRMDETITSLLQLAEVGSISSNSFSKIDFTGLVSRAAEDLQAISPKRQIASQLAAVSLKGSEELLRRLLDNAIGNINRHTGKADAVRITLASERRQAVLTVEDAGPGLPDEAYARGIQGFRRFDESRSRETGGTGLGMTLMSSIVEAHSGSMTIARSELGGLKLEIRLPLN
jgi:two-component system OmpR family sensor kinase